MSRPDAARAVPSEPCRRRRAVDPRRDARLPGSVRIAHRDRDRTGSARRGDARRRRVSGVSRASELRDRLPAGRWYRESGGRLEPAPTGAGDTWQWAGGAALCARRAGAAAGAWLCRAASARGDRTARLRLLAERPLAVTLRPALAVRVRPVRRAASSARARRVPTVPVPQVARGGSAVRFTCAGAGGAALSWRHDGAALAGARGVLELRASRAAQGVYQCEARRGRRAASASAELRLAGASRRFPTDPIERFSKSNVTRV